VAATDANPWAVEVSGLAWVSITGLSIEDSISGIKVNAVSAHTADGVVEVTDCVFKNVWNTSSIGTVCLNRFVIYTSLV
jgi:hypothetical protein